MIVRVYCNTMPMTAFSGNRMHDIYILCNNYELTCTQVLCSNIYSVYHFIYISFLWLASDTCRCPPGDCVHYHWIQCFTACFLSLLMLFWHWLWRLHKTAQNCTSFYSVSISLYNWVRYNYLHLINRLDTRVLYSIHMSISLYYFYTIIYI